MKYLIFTVPFYMFLACFKQKESNKIRLIGGSTITSGELDRPAVLNTYDVASQISIIPPLSELRLRL